MKTLSNEERGQLAGEYVLGTLRGPARRRFERLVQDDPLLWQEVARWESRLGTLGEALPELPPPSHVWTAIKAETGFDDATAPALGTAPDTGLLHRLSFWRGFSLVAAGLAAALFVIVVLPGEQPLTPTQVATLQGENAKGAWLVRVARDGTGEITPVGSPDAPRGKDLELWLLRNNDQPPLSVGLASTVDRVRFRLPDGTTDGTGFAISVEPPGGSPTGLPTGPVIFVGNLAGTPAN